jgi:predicted DNA-binding protein
MKDRLVNQGVKLTAEVKAKLETRASQEGRTSSSLVRIIVENYLNTDGQESEDQRIRRVIADALKIILATRGRGPMSSEMADSLVDTLFLSQES